jgi:hypothetical protein
MLNTWIDERNNAGDRKTMKWTGKELGHHGKPIIFYHQCGGPNLG